MVNKLLVTDSGIYVNNHLECLKKYKEDLRIIKLYAETEIDSDEEVLDISAFYENYQTDAIGFDSWQYQCIDAHKSEIADVLLMHGYKPEYDWYSDVIILVDSNNLDALYVFQALQKADYKGNIHLVLPLPFERAAKGTIQYELLSDLSKVRTLAIYDPYKLALSKYGNIESKTVEQIISETTEYLLKRYDELFFKMEYMSDATKYFYDFSKNSFVDTESLYILDDYEITHTLGLQIDPYICDRDKEENNYFISCLTTPIPRPDGKQVCQQLRLIRKQFAELNSIPYEFRKCTYDGPCAGTCAACDKEAQELTELSKSLVEVVYPNYELEDDDENS